MGAAVLECHAMRRVTRDKADRNRYCCAGTSKSFVLACAALPEIKLIETGTAALRVFFRLCVFFVWVVDRGGSPAAPGGTAVPGPRWAEEARKRAGAKAAA